jgi:hypothetical protein
VTALPRWRPPAQVLLVAAGLIGALAGGWLVARWCFGVVLIAESAGAVLVGLFRDDGRRPPRSGEKTIADVLEYARQAN